MNAFTIAATLLLLGFIPLGALCLLAREIDGVAALQLCGTLATLILICLAEGFHRSAYVGVAVVCATLTLIGGLVFARFFGRFL